MTEKAISTIVIILTAVIGVAIIATLVSKQSNTAGVLSAGGSAFANALKTALSPVTGTGGFSFQTAPLGQTQTF